jgi:hypothetical protein
MQILEKLSDISMRNQSNLVCFIISDKEKSFITLTPSVNTIKPFSSLMTFNPKFLIQ